MSFHELSVIYVLLYVSCCCCWNLEELSELKYKLFSIVVKRV